MPNTEIGKRVTAVKELLEAFRMERILYVTISCLAIVILVTVASIIIFRNPDKIEWFVGLFVPAGAITFSVGRILRMWTQALKFVNNQKSTDDEI